MNRFTRGEQLALVSAGVVAIGAFLPWITASILGTSITVTGLDGDGIFTLAMAAAAGILVLVRDFDRVNRAAVALLGVLITGLAALYITDPAFGIDQTGPGAQLAKEALSPGIGLYLTALGGVGLIVAGVLDTVRGNGGSRGQPPQR